MAENLPLIYHPNSLLRQVSKPLELEEIQSDEFTQLILDMEKTMEENKGVGLAAVQIGKLLRLTVIQTDEGLLPLINPEIIKKSWRKELGEEGCLSIPKVYGMIKRSKDIEVKSVGLDGKPIQFKAHGFFARVIQHEIDHMNGILFIDHAKKITHGVEELKRIEHNKNE